MARRRSLQFALGVPSDLRRSFSLSDHDNYYGGGRTFNGPPHTGGGVIRLELSWLMTAKNFPFLSTLIHELGHAFGLFHADATATTWMPTVR